MSKEIIAKAVCAHCGVRLGTDEAPDTYAFQCFRFDGKLCCAACYCQLIGPRKMQALIDSFPSLKRRGSQWIKDDPMKFRKQMKGMSHGERCAAAFVLMVYNQYDFKFDFNDAMSVMDQESVEVIRQWMANRWWM